MSKALVASTLVCLLCLQGVYAELRDPTRPAKYVDNPSTESVDTSKLELGLTLVSSDRKVVVINGLTLRVGDEVGSERIVTIESNCVRLVGPTGNITLFLLDEPVKEAVN